MYSLIWITASRSSTRTIVSLTEGTSPNDLYSAGSPFQKWLMFIIQRGKSVGVNRYPNSVLEGHSRAGFSVLPPRKVRAVLPGRTENLARLHP